MHEQDDKLLHKALETVHKAQKTINSQQSAIASLQATVQSLQNKVALLEKNHLVLKNKKPETVTFRLSEYQKKKEANEYFQFTPFYTHPNGYHMALANGVVRAHMCQRMHIFWKESMMLNSNGHLLEK